MIGSIEKRIVVQHRSNEASKRLETIPGIGIIGATAIAATVPDPKVFRSGRDLAAWDWVGAARRLNWWQTEAWADLKTGRPISEAHSGGRSPLRIETRATAPGEESM